MDEDEFFQCTFSRCEVVYQGGEKAYLVGCRFEDGCSFRLEGAATRTLGFLRGMYHSMGAAGQRLVENTFDEIRRADPRADPQADPTGAERPDANDLTAAAGGNGAASAPPPGGKV